MLIVAQVLRRHVPNIYQQTLEMIQTPKTKRETRRAALFLLLACLSVVALASDARAQQAAATQVTTKVYSIQLIPAPKSVKETAETFRLSRGVRIVLADAKSEDDRFAAQDFADDLKETTGVALRVGTGGGKRQILVGPLSNERVRRAVERAGVAVPADLNEESYVLSVNADSVVVAGKSSAG